MGRSGRAGCVVVIPVVGPSYADVAEPYVGSKLNCFNLTFCTRFIYTTREPTTFNLDWSIIIALRASSSDLAFWTTSTYVHITCISQKCWSRELMDGLNPSIYIHSNHLLWRIYITTMASTIILTSRELLFRLVPLFCISEVFCSLFFILRRCLAVKEVLHSPRPACTHSFC